MDNNPLAPTNILVGSQGGSTPNVETHDVNRELSTYNEILALELTNVKKQLETQSHIEGKCARQNLKSEFDHELQHKTLAQGEIIHALQHQIDQLGHSISSSRWPHIHCCPRLPHHWM